MGLPTRTQEDANFFADTIEDNGDRELFLDLFYRSEFATIEGHFPAFYVNTDAPKTTRRTTKKD